MANVDGNLHLIIRDERIKQGLSQKKLGELVDLPQQAINRIEQGNRKMDVDLFLKFCEILKIDKIGNFSIKMISSFYEMDGDPITNFNYGGLPDVLNDYTQELGEFLYHNPNHKALFDASMEVKSSDVDFAKQMLDRINGKTGE